MKKVKYIARNILMGLALLATTISPLVTLPVNAQVESLWTGNDPLVHNEGPSQPYKYPPGVFCQNKTLPISKTGLPPFQNTNLCTVETNYGEVGHGFLKFKNTNEFIRMEPSIGGVLAIPNSQAMFVIRSSAGFINLHAYNNPAAKIYKDTGGDGWAYMYRTSSATDWTLKDNENRPLAMRAYAVSKNGRWLAIEIPGGIIRFDTVSRQFFKFTTSVPPYGVGRNPNLHMAVSNDGRYVAVGGGNYSANLNVYNLIGCVPPEIQNSTSIATGCGNKRLTPVLENNIAGFNGAFQLEFNGDGTQLRMNTIVGRTMLQANGTTPSNITYLGLGDSFSSGEGAYSYLPGTDADGTLQEGVDISKEKCHVGVFSYPYLVGMGSGLSNEDSKNIACSGALANNVLDIDSSGQFDQLSSNDPTTTLRLGALASFFPGRAAQIEFVEKHKPRAITLTIGGNDVGFANKLAECVISISSCKYASDPTTKRGVFESTRSQFDNLRGLYNKLHEASPTTRIYVLGYPNFTGNAPTCEINTGLIDPSERTFIKESTSYMNDVIEAASKNAGVYYIDVENSLAGKELCSDSAQKAFNGIKFGNDNWIFGNESFHPNALGHSLMSQAVLSNIGNVVTHQPCADASQTVCPDSSITAAPTLPASVVSAIKPLYSPILSELTQVSTVNKSHPGISLKLSNLKPGENVSFEIHSDPTPLGMAQADSNGNVEVSLILPTTVPAGYHTIHAYTNSLSGEKVDLYQHLTVLGQEGDRDEDGVPDATDACAFVPASGTDYDRDGIDDACDGQITEPLDTIAPTVNGAADRLPNERGWHNTDVTINWTSTDPEPSSGTPTQPSATLVNQEGEATYTSTESCDPANNCSTGNFSLKLDKTAPSLGTPSWDINPKSAATTANLRMGSSDDISGVSKAEYYLGDTDPGQGNGAPMMVGADGTLSASFGADYPTGVYKVTMRAKDHAGNWSSGASDYLVVQSGSGTRMTGKRTLLPSLENGDALPGLISSSQDDLVKFGFNVRYDKLGFIHTNSDLQLKYKTGSHCNKPAKAANCHELELNATSIDWLATSGFNNSTGVFQGRANMNLDGASSQVMFRITGKDGELLNSTSQDHIEVKIYNSSDNPNFSAPIYKTAGQVLRGNIKIRTD